MNGLDMIHIFFIVVIFMLTVYTSVYTLSLHDALPISNWKPSAIIFSAYAVVLLWIPATTPWRLHAATTFCCASTTGGSVWSSRGRHPRARLISAGPT